MTKERACANGQTMSRRTLLAALPASTLALAPAASSTPSDPILEHYREWLDANREWKQLSDMPGNEDWKWPESIEAEKRGDKALEAMIELTPTSLEGIAAMVHVLWYLEGPASRPELPGFEDEMTMHGNKAMFALWRAASGRAGPPSFG